jgi:type I pantothenate kinase
VKKTAKSHSKPPPNPERFSPYQTFTREAWSHLKIDTALTLSESELEKLKGTNERVSIDEVVDIYLPLCRLLNLHVAATLDLYRASNEFLGTSAAKVPYVIGLAGSVAVGKSTTARILQALLARWPSHPKVDLITTDGYLLANHVLQERGLMQKKGFPESYDARKLISFLSKLKAGRHRLKSPIYSHISYDLVPNEYQLIDQPDILIVEGLNVLQIADPYSGKQPSIVVSDFFDFSIYVHADAKVIKEWYIERFLTFRKTAFKDPGAYFHRYASLSNEEAHKVASSIWDNINGANLVQNIMPTKRRARLILEKGEDHVVESVLLRKL